MNHNMMLISFARMRSLRHFAIFLIVVFLSTGCSSISIEGARQLGASGKDVVVQHQRNILASDEEYQRAMDAESLFHGISGTMNSPAYKAILELYDKIQLELSSRSVVFSTLAGAYDAFGNLAGLDASTEVETSIGNLGGAVNSYAVAIGQEPVISDATTGVISRIGGLVAAEVQKEKIKEASILIRKRLKTFVELFEDPLVREQILGFKSVLGSNRKAAIEKLWDKGVYSPKPLLDEMGAEAGFVAQTDAITLVIADKQLSNGLWEVANRRLSHKIGLIEKGYDASVKALKRLIAEHEKLEKGQELDLSRLRQIAARLQSIASLLKKTPTENSEK